jgi:predicted ribosome quality control (RQC) complex YloA/Tae2 family protein
MAIAGSFHQHYHFTRQLAAAIRERFTGAVLNDAFTLSKTELVLLFTKNNQPLNIKVIARFHAGFLLFENVPYHKGSNAQACFGNIYNQEVSGVDTHAYNRSFCMNFTNGSTLIFKCYDALINVVLLEEGEVSDVFRESILNDWTYDAEEFNVYDPAVIARLDAVQLEEGRFYIYKNEATNDYRLTLAPCDMNEVLCTDDALEASSVFARYEMSVLAFNQAKLSRIASVEGEIKRYRKQIKLSEQGIHQLIHESPFEETGHLIMANLHAIKAGDKEVKVFNFYTNKDTVIKLKTDLSPAANAEYYYRKARNKRIETEQMEQKLLSMRKKLAAQEVLLDEVKQASNNKELKTFQPTRKQQEVFPFKRFVCEGFEIWVGKNAANNDLLTQKYSHKNDLWLHAKDVSGSHTVIKHKAGKTFNTTVITIAAQIAAYYSRHKGNALAPVSYTLKKFVRKPKGSEPGQVIIDREEVIMVEPGLPGN